ncbi:UNVERIFIED_ORG: hypothetical protein M2402_002559 [Rahnella aquatilis]
MSDKSIAMRSLRKAKLSTIKNKLAPQSYYKLLHLLDIGNYEQFDYLMKRIKETQEDTPRSTALDLDDLASLEQEEWESNTSHDEDSSLYNERSWTSPRVSELEEENKKLTSIFVAYRNQLEKLTEQLKTSNIEQKDKDSAIKDLNAQVIELRGKVQQNRIDEKIPGYVDGVKEKLDTDDNYFIKMSNRWAIAGGISATGAIISAFVTFFFKVNFINITNTELIYVFTRGLLGIALLSWLSYICFSNSKKYTHESIRRKDRQHALMFGKIFLQIYGTTATKEDAINVFKDWNMSGDSAFSDPTEQPPGVQTLIASAMEKLSPKDKNKE